MKLQYFLTNSTLVVSAKKIPGLSISRPVAKFMLKLGSIKNIFRYSTHIAVTVLDYNGHIDVMNVGETTVYLGIMPFNKTNGYQIAPGESLSGNFPSGLSILDNGKITFL